VRNASDSEGRVSLSSSSLTVKWLDSAARRPNFGCHVSKYFSYSDTNTKVIIRAGKKPPVNSHRVLGLSDTPCPVKSNQIKLYVVHCFSERCMVDEQICITDVAMNESPFMQFIDNCIPATRKCDEASALCQNKFQVFSGFHWFLSFPKLRNWET
jgi:hypothetical protein